MQEGRAGVMHRRRAKRLLRKYPELYKMFKLKRTNKKHPQVFLGTDGLPYITFNNDWTIGRNYMVPLPDGGLQIGA